MATSIKIDEGLKRRIDRLAAAKDRSAHWIMREAIREYVELEEAGGRAERAQAPYRADAAVPGSTSRRGALREPSLPPAELAGGRPEARSPLDALSGKPADPAITPYERFMSLAGAGARLRQPLSKSDIDGHIRWLRGDD